MTEAAKRSRFRIRIVAKLRTALHRNLKKCKKAVRKDGLVSFAVH
jgi:hypothetical protein